MTYDEAVAYLETFINYERKPSYTLKAAFKLERIKEFLVRLGSPERRLKVIHVAGTKGKGSTACFIAQILKEEGYRVGLYTSPHLKEFRERIRILDPHNTADEKTPFPGMILKNDFAHFLGSLRPAIDAFHRDCAPHGPLTFFEVLTALAFKYFQEKNTDFVVLETGMGGRLDATNAADSLLSVIAPIGYDHEQVLGGTLAEIAFEKACIVKETNQKTREGFSLCVCATQKKEAADIIRRRCKTVGALLFEMDKDFYFKKLSGDLSSQDFYYRGIDNGSFFFNIRMLGDHQFINASLALAAVQALSLHGLPIRSDAMARGLKNAFWPGRLEIISTQPFIILDGAHNKESLDRLVHFLEREFKKMRKWFIFGASSDKDIGMMAECLEPLAHEIILTRADNPRAADPLKHLKPYFKKKTPRLTASVQEAVGILNENIAMEDMAVVTGSLFVVGEARSLWQR